MNIFGLGPLEILLIILVALILFGPKDIQKAGKTIGTMLNKLVRSDGWRAVTQTSRELKNLPNRLMRESGLDEIQAKTRKDLSDAANGLNQARPDVGRIQPPLVPKPAQENPPPTAASQSDEQGNTDA
jgi:Sec-independent protein translocase protein TatA